MKKLLLLAATFAVGISASNAQTTATDFTQMDCGGTSHNLFTDLDAGKVVILEWYMGPSCQPCKDAAKEIESLKQSELASHPGKIKSYTWGFQDSYTCSDVESWLFSVGSSAIGMDTGATLLANYGGFSMPTVAVVAGTDHKIIYIANPNNSGYIAGDTSKIRAAINNFFSPTSVGNLPQNVSNVAVFPSPALSDFTVRVQLNSGANIQTQILNLNGQVVMQLPTEKATSNYVKIISTESIAAGNYTVRIIADGAVINRSLTIVK